MENLWTTILAVASAIVLLSNAIEKIVKAVKAAKAPETAQDKKIAALETRVSKLEVEVQSDEKHLKELKACNHVITKGVLALLDHSINGNNIEQMKDARHDVEAYLINH